MLKAKYISARNDTYERSMHLCLTVLMSVNPSFYHRLLMTEVAYTCNIMGDCFNVEAVSEPVK